jgi:glycosyltransferase involved in cell wall biosynthesis
VVVPADHGADQPRDLDGVAVHPVRYAAAEREDLAYAGDMIAKVRSVSGAWAFRGLLRALAAGTRAAARRLDAHLVHAFWWMPAGWSAVGGRHSVVLSLMGTDVALMRSIPARLAARRVLRRARAVSAISTYLADQARERTDLASLMIDRVPMPADTTRFTGTGPGGGGIVYLGRLSGQKRVDLLLRALKAAAIDAPVTIIGDGPARPALEADARRLGLGNVHFRGQLDDDAVVATLRDADVLAFPSRHEGLGLVAAEAQMLGVPVVATTDGGGVLDLLEHGAGARIVAPEPAAYGAALKACLGDAALRQAAARAGERLRDALAPDAIAERFELVYARVAR